MKTTDSLALELHKKFDLERPEYLDLQPDPDLVRLRLRLIREESAEVFEEFEKLLGARRTLAKYMIMLRLAKELADLRMVIEGAAVSFGIDLESVYREVHRSNMTKERHPDGGKLIKGEAYSAADVESVIKGAIIQGEAV